MRTFKLSIYLFFIFNICFYFITIPCFAGNFDYIWSTEMETSANIVTQNSTTNNIVNTTNQSNDSSTDSKETGLEITDDNFLNLDCGSAILIEQTTGQILYAYNIHERLHPASGTKIMSILLIMESLDSGKISLDDQVPCSENAASMGGSQIWLDPRETLTVDDMLKAICVNSANDRCCCNGRISCWKWRSICSNDEW